MDGVSGFKYGGSEVFHGFDGAFEGDWLWSSGDDVGMQSSPMNRRAAFLASERLVYISDAKIVVPFAVDTRQGLRNQSLCCLHRVRDSVNKPVVIEQHPVAPVEDGNSDRGLGLTNKPPVSESLRPIGLRPTMTGTASPQPVGRQIGVIAARSAKTTGPAMVCSSV